MNDFGGDSFAYPLGGGPGDPVNGAWGWIGINANSYDIEDYLFDWTPSAGTGGVGYNWPGGSSFSQPPVTSANVGASTSAVFFQTMNDPLDLVVFNYDLTFVGVAELLDTGDDITYSNVVWTGSEYLVSWVDNGLHGYFAFVDETASMSGTHQVPTTGGLVSTTTNVASATNGAQLAIAYTGPPPEYGVTLALIAPTGGFAGSPAVLDMGPPPYPSTHMVWAAAGMPGAFAVLWGDTQSRDLYATYIPIVGGALSSSTYTVTVDGSGTAYTRAMAGYDGVGAAFLLGSAETISFAYWNGVQLTTAMPPALGLPVNPFELSVIGSGSSALVGTLSGSAGGRLSASYSFGTSALTVRQVGYCSLSGSDCASNSNCCSGACTPQVAAGPKAYSTCR